MSVTPPASPVTTQHLSDDGPRRARPMGAPARYRPSHAEGHWCDFVETATSLSPAAPKAVARPCRISRRARLRRDRRQHASAIDPRAFLWRREIHPVTCHALPANCNQDGHGALRRVQPGSFRVSAFSQPSLTSASTSASCKFDGYAADALPAPVAMQAHTRGGRPWTLRPPPVSEPIRADTARGIPRCARTPSKHHGPLSLLPTPIWLSRNTQAVLVDLLVSLVASGQS